MQQGTGETQATPWTACGGDLLSATGGRTLVLSGLTGTGSDGTAPPRDPVIQAELAVATLVESLRAAGATTDDLVKLTVHATEAAAARRPEIAAIVARTLPRHVAIAWIRVVALEPAEVLLSLEAIAAPPATAGGMRAHGDGLVIISPAERGINPDEQTRGMRRESGATPETSGTVALWSGYVTTPAGMLSGAHHHGDAESAIYMLHGEARFTWGERLQHGRIARPGDFIYVPPRVIHAEENLSQTEPVIFVVSRNSGTMTTVNVDLDS